MIKRKTKKMNRKEIESRLIELKQEKKQLKKQLNDLPSLEVGKWYWASKGHKNQALVFVESFGCNRDYFNGYGFNLSGWNSLCNNWYYSAFDKPATSKEVETALIAEAKKRGFKEGVLCNNSIIKNRKFDNFLFDNRVFFYNSKVNSLEWRRNGVGDSYNEWTLFYKGKWAEIIEEPKTVHIPEGDYTETQLKDILNNKFNK